MTEHIPGDVARAALRGVTVRRYFSASCGTKVVVAGVRVSSITDLRCVPCRLDTARANHPSNPTTTGDPK